jgi:uncharacterized DUF497 family protein
MRFEWDEDKSRRNQAKHKVSFKPPSRFSTIPGRSAFRIALSMERSDGRRLEWYPARF